jgi:hypothetical protein
VSLTACPEISDCTTCCQIFLTINRYWINILNRGISSISLLWAHSEKQLWAHAAMHAAIEKMCANKAGLNNVLPPFLNCG